MNSENNETQNNQNQNRASCSLCGCSWQLIFSRIKDVITKPKTVWPGIKAEDLSIKDLYLKYLIPLATIPAIFGLIGQSIVGIHIPYVGTFRTPFFQTLVNQVLSLALTLIVLYLSAIIVEFLATKFSGKTDTCSALKLIGFAGIPAFVASILSIIPVLGILGALVSLYGLYIYLQGIPVMTGVPEEKKLPFFFASIIAIFIASLIFGLIFSSFLMFDLTSDAMPAINEAASQVSDKFDVEKMNEFINKMQEMAPKETN